MILTKSFVLFRVNISVQDKVKFEMENENIDIIYEIEESPMPQEDLNLNEVERKTNISFDDLQDNDHDFTNDQDDEVYTEVSQNIIEIEEIEKSGNIEKQKSSNTNELYSKELNEKSFKCQDCALTLTEAEKISHERLNPSHIIKAKLKSDFLCKLCNISFGKKVCFLPRLYSERKVFYISLKNYRILAFFFVACLIINRF